MIRKPKRTVVDAIKHNGKWTGFLAANKISPAHINGLWCLGMKVTFTNLEELERTVEKFTYYNCSDELGNRVSFYELT